MLPLSTLAYPAPINHVTQHNRHNYNLNRPVTEKLTSQIKFLSLQKFSYLMACTDMQPTRYI